MEQFSHYHTDGLSILFSESSIRGVEKMRSSSKSLDFLEVKWLEGSKFAQ